MAAADPRAVGAYVFCWRCAQLSRAHYDRTTTAAVVQERQSDNTAPGADQLLKTLCTCCAQCPVQAQHSPTRVNKQNASCPGHSHPKLLSDQWTLPAQATTFLEPHWQDIRARSIEPILQALGQGRLPRHELALVQVGACAFSLCRVVPACWRVQRVGWQALCGHADTTRTAQCTPAA